MVAHAKSATMYMSSNIKSLIKYKSSILFAE